MAQPHEVGPAAPPPGGLDRWFPAQAPSVARARRLVSGWLRASIRGHDVLIGDVALAVSEACTNVVVHAYHDGAADGDAFRVVAERDGPAILVIVSDDGHGMVPRPDSPGLGLGLPLIASLTDSVEVRAPAGGGTGTVVEMRFSTTEAPTDQRADTGSARPPAPRATRVAPLSELQRVDAYADVDGDPATLGNARLMAVQGDPDFAWLMAGLVAGDAVLVRIDVDAHLRGVDGARSTCSSAVTGVWIERGSVPSVELQVSHEATAGLDDVRSALHEQGIRLSREAPDGVFIHVELSRRLRNALSVGRAAVASLTALDAASKELVTVPAGSGAPLGEAAAKTRRDAAHDRGACHALRERPASRGRRGPWM